MKKLPISTYTFERIITENQLYVDKTRQMYELMQISHLIFLSRPRRFGKSLLLSTYAALFEGKKELFKGLWIEDKIDWQSYPIVHINFAALTYNRSQDIFDESGIRILSYIAKKHNITLNGSTFGDCLDDLIVQLHEITGKKVVLLIDEYDKPISDHLTQPVIAERNRGWLRDTFEKLKGREGILKFFMITGISKFAKTSIFSVLNNIEDITLMPQFNDVIGFTKKEIQHYFSDFITAFKQNQQLTEEEIFEKIRYWYDGYSWDGNQKIYNPYSVVHIFKYFKFKNFWFETGTPHFLISLIKEKYAFERKIDVTILEFEQFQTDTSIYKAYDLENIDLVSLLLQTGYLTIVERIEQDGEDDIILSYPNQEVRLSFSTYLLEAFTKKNLSLQLPRQTIPLKRALREKNMELFLNHIQSFFASIPYILRKEANEAYYQTVFYALLTSLGFQLILEKMTDKGRIDAVLKLKNVIYIIEFKYSQTGTLDYWLKEGMKQIHEVGYYEQYQDNETPIFLIAIAFLDKLEKKKVASKEEEKRVLTIDYLCEVRKNRVV